MNEADRKALEEHHKDTEGCSRRFRSGFTHGFIAGCEWRDSQVGEPVALEKVLAELLKSTYSGKESYYNDEQISDACYTKAFEIALIAKRKGIQLYTTPPTAQINQQMREALEHAVKIAENKVPGTWDDLLQYKPILQAALAATPK